MNLPKRLELWFARVAALPNASKSVFKEKFNKANLASTTALLFLLRNNTCSRKNLEFSVFPEPLSPLITHD